jgi:hypothetical protein
MSEEQYIKVIIDIIDLEDQVQELRNQINKQNKLRTRKRVKVRRKAKTVVAA